MARFLAGALACFLMMTGAFLLWQGRAENGPKLPPPPPMKTPLPAMVDTKAPRAPVASEKSREEKRFDRADKDKDGKIFLTELLEPRKKAFASSTRMATVSSASRNGRTRRSTSSAGRTPITTSS